MKPKLKTKSEYLILTALALLDCWVYFYLLPGTLN